MTALGEFILARVMEDERRIDDALYYHDLDGKRLHPRDESEPVEVTKARIFRRELAECEAKREIVGAIERAIVEAESRPHFFGVGILSVARPVLANLAAPYVDHPDYREEWRP